MELLEYRRMFHVKLPESDGSAPPPPSAREVFGDRQWMAESYHRMLATDGVTLGLIGPREVPRLWERHLLNCAVIGEVLAEGESVFDIGSGAGLPGIPVAIARPDLAITLIEPLLRRSEFLTRVVDELGLVGVRVVRGRAEEKVVRDAVGVADVVTSRAVAPLDRLAKWSAPLIRQGGRMVAIKGSSAPDEVARDQALVGRVGISELTVKQCGSATLDVPTTVVIGTKRTKSRVGKKG